MKRIVLILAILLGAGSLFAQTPAAITGSSFVCIGSTTLLSDATPGGTWSSSSTAIATVGGTTGIVLGVSVGSVAITYTTSGGFVVRVMTVKPLPTLTPSSLRGCVNSNYTLSPSPAGGSWSSSNTAIAVVNFAGVITGVAPGVTNIIYTAAGGCPVSAAMTVNPIPAPITGTNFCYTGLTTSLSDISPGGTWSSANPGLATVGAGTGIVTGVSAGLLYISYTLPTTCASIYRVEVDPLPARTNLQAWYPFCGDTTDHSGNGRDLIDHGIVTGPAVLTTDRFGNANSAYQFNGVNSMMNYTTFFPNSGTPPDFTYSVWVNPTAAQSSIIMYNGDPTANGFGFVMNNGTMGVAGTQVGVYFGGSGTLYASQAVTVGPGMWSNLVLVKSGGVYHFYINNGAGVFFLETNTPLFSDVFALGLNYHSTLPGFGPIRDAYSGGLDDIAVINRQLTAAERLSLFNFNPDARKFTLGNDTTICSDVINLSPNPQTIGAIYKWGILTPGFGYSTFDTTDTMVVVYPSTGPFGNTYDLIVTKPYGCTASDTITVFKAPIPVNLGPDLDLCKGDTINLSNFFPSADFLWSTGDTAHSIEVTTTGVYYVTVDSIYNGATCVGRDTVQVRFHAPPVIGLATGIRNCNGSPYTIHAPYDPGYTYLWSTGVTTDSLLVTTSGTYWVRVSDSGCIRTDTSVVLIVFDTFTFVVTDTAICRGGKVPIRDRVTVNPIVGYQWTPTAGMAASNIPQPIIIPDTSAWYYLHVTYPGCPDLVDSFHIDVQPNPKVFIGGNHYVCRKDTIHITAEVTPSWYDHYIFSWTPATSLDCSTCQTVVFTPGDSVKLYLTVTTPAWYPTLTAGCISVDSGWIFVQQQHFDSLVQTTFNLCPGDSIRLVANDSSTQGSINVAYHWTPGIYLEDTTIGNPWVHATTSEDYRLVAVSQWGCRDTMYAKVLVHPEALINLEDSVTIYPGESYHIQPQTNCSHFVWFPPLELNNEFFADPVATPNVNTLYRVQAMTEAGCLTTDSIKIRVDPNSILTIPNAFSPGSAYNNTFNIIKRGIVSLSYFRVFDRWGVMVFETKNIDEGWDGMFKAKPQPFGVYVYELEATTNTGRKIKRQGNVTLVR